MSWLLIILQAMQAAPTTPTLDLATLEAQTLARHPAIRRAAADVEAARSRAAQKGAWPNPVVGGSTEELRPRESPSGYFGGFIQQTIPLGGTLGASRAVGERELAVAEAALATTRQQIVADVRDRYYRVLVAEERRTVAAHLSELASESAVIAKQLFNVGIADQPDVLTSEAEAAQARAVLVSVNALRLAAWQRLAAATADPSLVPQKLAGSISDALPTLDRDATLTRVLAENASLQEAARGADTARASVNLEKRVTRPDLYLRFDGGANREISDGRAIGPQFGLEAGISVPLFNRNHGGIASATSRVLSADATVDDMRLDLTGRFAEVFAQYDGARAMVDAYRVEILPRVERAYALQLAKYREMAAAYPAVLLAQRMVFQMNDQYLDAIERAWMASNALRSALAIR